MATFDQFINSIIADGNDGKAFEKFCKHFLETSPEYAHQFEKVWMWDEWPNKWSHDKGVDLVAKYKGRDTYCAVQAKCYAAHNTVPYNEVTNFLADSSRSEIANDVESISVKNETESVFMMLLFLGFHAGEISKNAYAFKRILILENEKN